MLTLCGAAGSPQYPFSYTFIILLLEICLGHWPLPPTPYPAPSLLLLESLCPNDPFGWGTNKITGHLLQCPLSPHLEWHQGLWWSINSVPSREEMSFSPSLQGNLAERGLLDVTTIPCPIFTHDFHESFLSQPQKKSWASLHNEESGRNRLSSGTIIPFQGYLFPPVLPYVA